MPRRTQRSLVSELRQMGLHFRELEVVTEGDYSIADVEWNYKDVPHLNKVHTRAANVNGLTEVDAEASINIQKVLGFRLPLVLCHYETAPDCHTYFFTMLAYTVVCETTFETTPQGRSRVVTTYAVGGHRAPMLLFPLIAKVLRHNYRTLMSEDVPMRERRGQLRSWGYSFKGDGASRSFVDSPAIERDNVVLCTTPTPPPLYAPLSTLTPEHPLLWGRSDHVGVRLERQAAGIDVYPRMCPHEGACLDSAALVGRRLDCPWHGRAIEPLGTVPVGGGVLATEYLRVEVDGGTIRVEAASQDVDGFGEPG